MEETKKANPKVNQNQKEKITSSDDLGFPKKSYEDDLDETERRHKTEEEVRQSNHRF